MKKLFISVLATFCGVIFAAAQFSSGRVESGTAPSDILGESRNYSIYLPKSYKINPDKTYSVFYLLHGGGDTNTAWVELRNEH